MMRFLIFSVCFLLAMPALAQVFFTALPDVPLMVGLSELDERALSFDKPEGRIMVGAALIDDSVDIDSLQSYYRQALPAFGWVPTSSFSYQRGDERLNMRLIKKEKSRILEITISP